MQPSPLSSPKSREPLLTRSFLLAALSHFLHALAFNLYLHLSSFLKERGASETIIGYVFGVAGAAAVLARPPMGRIMDQRGPLAIVRVGGLLHVIVCALYMTVSGAGPWITFVRVAHSVAEASIFTSLFAFASEIVPASRRFEGLALFGVSGMFPIALGSALGDAILARGTYEHLFMTSIALAGAAFLLSLPLTEPPRKTHDEPARGMFAALRQPDLVPIWIAGMVFAVCVAAVFTFFAAFVKTVQIGSAGLFFSCYSISAITLRIVAGTLPARVGPKRVLLPAMCSIAAGLAALAFARSPLHVGVAGVLSGMGHGYTFPILLGLLVSRAREAERGAALALFTALFDAGSMLGSPLFGAIVEATSYRVMFGTAAAIMAIGTGVFVATDRGRS